MGTIRLSLECPVCSTDYEVKVSIFKEALSLDSEIKVLIQQAWSRFLVWNLFGRPKRGYFSEGGQLWYDPYHEHVEFERRGRLTSPFK